WAEISWGVQRFPSTDADQEVPISRLMERKVRSGLVIAWRFATSPTRISPPLLKATTEGVVRCPSALGMTTGSPPSRTETTELVVPRSIPTAFGMAFLSFLQVVLPWRRGPPWFFQPEYELSVMVSNLLIIPWRGPGGLPSGSGEPGHDRAGRVSHRTRGNVTALRRIPRPGVSHRGGATPPQPGWCHHH